MKESSDRRQQGQSIIIIAVALLALIIFAAIAVDVANTYVHRRTAQNAADAAALAGARELARQLNEYEEPWEFSEDLIKAEMNDFAERNGTEDTDGIPANPTNNNVWGYYLDYEGERVSEAVIGSTGIVHPEARGVEAFASSEAPSFFSGILGFDAFPVQADSAVVFEGACSDICIMPIATYTETFVTGECYNIYDGAEPGSFGWLHWQFQKGGEACRCSVPCLRDNMDPLTCNSGRIQVGDWVASDSGISNDKCIRNRLRCYMGFPLEPGCAITCDNPDPEPFTVIIYDATECMGGKCDECAKEGPRGFAYHVAGFAKFQLLGYSLSSGGGGGSSAGHDGYGCLGPEPTGGNRLTGMFIEWVEGEGGDCDPYGSIIAPRVIR